jgi:hypothetical protein
LDDARTQHRLTAGLEIPTIQLCRGEEPRRQIIQSPGLFIYQVTRSVTV